MARAGRKRKQGLYQVREPNGRLSRALEATVEACSPAEVRRLRDAALVGLRDEMWGSEIGRLFLDNKISAEEFEAGKRWARMAALYNHAISAPSPDARACSFERRGKSHSPDPDSKEGQIIVERDRRAVEEMNAALAAMRDAHAALLGAGMLAERSVRAVCERDEAPEGYAGLESLKLGLLWVAKHWGIIEAPRGSRSFQDCSR